MFTVVRMSGRWIASKDIDLIDKDIQEGIEFTAEQGTPVIVCSDLEDFCDLFSVNIDVIEIVEG